MSDIIRREEFGEVVILHIITTSVDAVSAAAISAEYEAMRPITVLDFREVSFINSAGISALLKFVVSARKSGYKLFAMHVSPHHQKIFKMVEMSRFMPTIDERDLAEYR
ncbi:Sulfate transporter/antisigma-factor antagonist STAS [Oscillochloris trichoides DG-6]|uniref:Sulfate transporter/antisigma-factor antagonist STAS n=1 Tax=Oscillochloris trichoides DG-6 TaxID=765420 RepID=E1IGI6_9CHLR|nr:STAS domain-containing protein [Oscillochloris trichoides]EFO79752.1 Sulfate transporter/antisigma-factor antagonist STAS [Oscillochloris trichoides DG-6]